jgi:predicted MPP superfamily phosphohydrolase
LYKQKTKENTQYLYVNQGLGTIGYAGRLNMPPEITLLVLRQ